jgi:hypothetical protein
MAVLLPVFAGGRKGPGQSGTPHPQGWNTEEDGGGPVCCSARRPTAGEETGVPPLRGLAPRARIVRLEGPHGLVNSTGRSAWMFNSRRPGFPWARKIRGHSGVRH